MTWNDIIWNLGKLLRWLSLQRFWMQGNNTSSWRDNSNRPWNNHIINWQRSSCLQYLSFKKQTDDCRFRRWVERLNFIEKFIFFRKYKRKLGFRVRRQYTSSLWVWSDFSKWILVLRWKFLQQTTGSLLSLVDNLY